MRRPIRIGLVFSYGFAFYRGVARGIQTYAETRPHWHFNSVVRTFSRMPASCPVPAAS